MTCIREEEEDCLLSDFTVAEAAQLSVLATVCACSKKTKISGANETFYGKNDFSTVRVRVRVTVSVRVRIRVRLRLGLVLGS